MIFSLRSAHIPTVLLAISFAPLSGIAYHWPSPKIDTIEALLYESDSGPPGAASLVTILSKCVPLSFNNEIRAADWLRFGYHDMATHNVDDGTGGMDGSLHYELRLNRSENIGAGMTRTQNDFFPLSSKYVSNSDLIAMGVVLAVSECGGPAIPFRMGRVDATAAGPPGVPRPEQDLKTHTESFRKQGFTPTEMISLVACGHTLGGVRFPDFPEIIPPPPDDLLTPEIVVHFDSTPAMDNAVVTEYLNGTTQNPLVIHPNKTITSDLRIFSSDKNVTMKRLASPTVFRKTCQNLLERMINTVPKGVQLSDVVQFIPFKVDNVQLSVGQNSLRLTAMLRLSTANPARTVTMFWENRIRGPCKRSVCSAAANRTSDTTIELTKMLGLSPQKYHFDISINATTSISKFWFEVDEKNGKKPIIVDNGGTGYEITQDRVLYVPAKSGLVQVPSLEFVMTVAVRSDKLPSRVFANASWRLQTESRDETVELLPAPGIPPSAGYVFYNASVPGATHFTFDVVSVVDGKQYVDARKDFGFNGPESGTPPGGGPVIILPPN